MSLVPAVADVDASLQSNVDMLKELYLFGASNTENFEALRAAIATNADWTGSAEIEAIADGARAALGAFLDSLAAALLTPIIEGYAAIAGSTAPTFSKRYEDVRDYWEANSKTVESRAITFDTSATTGGTGNPTIRRLTVNKHGENIQTCYIGTTTMEVVRSQPQTKVGQEVLRIEKAPGYDVFSLLVSGESDGPRLRREVALRNRDSQWFRNLSFESPGTAGTLSAATTIGAWTLTSGAANLAIVADGYRESVVERANGSKFMLRATGDFDITQDITGSLLDDSPYDFGLWIYPDATAVAGAGSINITVGTQTLTVAMNTLSAGSWQLIGITLDENIYGENLKADNMGMRIYTSGTWAGQVDYDAVFFDVMQKFNGTWWHIIPGSTIITSTYTASFTDTTSAEGYIQWALWRAFRVSTQLPHSGTPSVADP